MRWTSRDGATWRLLGFVNSASGDAQLAVDVLRADAWDCKDATTYLVHAEALYQCGRRGAAIGKRRRVPRMDIYFASKSDAAYEGQETDATLQWYTLSWEIVESPASEKVTMLLNLCRDQWEKELEVAVEWCVRAVESKREYRTLVELGRRYHRARRYESAEGVRGGD